MIRYKGLVRDLIELKRIAIGLIGKPESLRSDFKLFDYMDKKRTQKTSQNSKLIDNINKFLDDMRICKNAQI